MAHAFHLGKLEAQEVSKSTKPSSLVTVHRIPQHRRMKTIIGMPRWMFWTLLAISLAALFAPLAHAEETSHVVTRTVLATVEGNDQDAWSKEFTARGPLAHQRARGPRLAVTSVCRYSLSLRPEPTTLEVINMTQEGAADVFVKEPRTVPLHVIGFAASFNVTVDESK